MSGKVFDRFRALDEALKLDPEVHAQARGVRAVLEGILRTAGLLEAALLQGSYGRKTMRRPLKDVDLVVVLPARLAHLRTTSGMSQWAMDEFRKAIEVAGLLPGVRFDVDKAPAHALQLTIPGLDFTVDLVPAFETEEPDQGWLYIADREKDLWSKRSDVRRLRDRVAARNKDCGGVWVNQVRQAKHSLDLDQDVNKLVFGLLVESLAYDVITKKVTPQEAMLGIFTAGAQQLNEPYSGLAQDDLTAKWTYAERTQVLRFFEQNRRRAAEAIRLERAGDTVGAIRVWHEVFGELFPVPDVSFAERLKTVSLIGGSVTPEGRLSTALGNVRPYRPWRAADPDAGACNVTSPSVGPGDAGVSMDALLASPGEVAERVAEGAVVWGAENVIARRVCGGAAVLLELDLLPLPETAVEGHATERVRLGVTRDREVLVYPLSARGRSWRHRNDFHPKMLCLQYPGDDPALLWLWSDGLEQLLTRVRLHLMCEEVYRRDNLWPGEELPHGLPQDGVVWPVASTDMRNAMRRWSR